MGISVWQLLIVLLIVLLLFGTKRIKSMGGDIGAAIKNFRGAVKDGEEGKEGKADVEDDKKLTEDTEGRVIEGEITAKKKEQV